MFLLCVIYKRANVPWISVPEPMLSGLELKCLLLDEGVVGIDKAFKLPVRTSRSTAGPGAGKRSIALELDGHRMKVGVTRDPGQKYNLIDSEQDYDIAKNGQTIAQGVQIIPIAMHAPYQAFINLEAGCIYDCAFCVTPSMGDTKTISPERWVELILDSVKKEQVDAVAVTSGIPEDLRTTTDGMLFVVENVREALSDMAIGVEPYIEDVEDIQRFKDAGADEIKLNIETATQALFDRVCPMLDRQKVFELLPKAVEVFGKGNVTSNIIVGLGESDEEVLAASKQLIDMGVVPTLRGLRVNDGNRDRLTEALGTTPTKVPSSRLVKLSEGLKKDLSVAGMFPLELKTMCHKCGCCDIEPRWDI